MFRRVLPFVFAALLLPQAASARQGSLLIRISDDPGFASEERKFEPGETVYVRVFARGFSAASVTAARLVVAPRHDGSAVERTLAPGPEGSFEGSVAVGELVGASSQWIVSASLSDGARTAAGRAVIALRDQPAPPAVSSLELEGPIQAIDTAARTMVVAGTTVKVLRETMIVERRSGRIDFSGLSVGMNVRVVAFTDAGGSVVARMIHAFEPYRSDDIHAAGKIESIDAAAGTIRVAGRTFTVTSETGITDAAGAVVPLDDLEVGQIARVEGILSSAGLIATSIRIESVLHADSAISGPVTDVGAGMVAVAGVEFAITDATRLHSGMDRSSLRLRRLVEVRFVPAADGSMTALRIRPVGPRGPGREPIRAFGTLQSKGSDAFSLSGIRFSFGPSTRWIDAAGTAISPDDVALGTRLRVWASYDAVTGLTALRIAVSEPVEVGSVVAGRTNDMLSLGDLEVGMTEDTEFLGVDGSPIDASLVTAGAFVDVVLFAEATVGKNASDSFLAEQVVVRSAASSTAVETGAGDTPDSFVLAQNYPNPFNPETTIRYAVKGDEGTVRLTVFSLLGSRIRTLVNGPAFEGWHEAHWDGRDDRGKEAASGVYLYRLEAPGQSAARVMTLIR